MTCPKCDGKGKRSLVQRKLKSRNEWVYEDQPCVPCKGKGYLTPEEQGLEKF